jgi:hypothetical protein
MEAYRGSKLIENHCSEAYIHGLKLDEALKVREHEKQTVTLR